jgi:predicted amidohydrolase
MVKTNDGLTQLTELPPMDLTPELLLQGGHVIDPAAGRDGIFDIAVGGGKIIAIAPSLSREGVESMSQARSCCRA